MNILITGGAGFIGCSLIKLLIKKNSEVLLYVIDNFSSGKNIIKSKQIKYFNFDISKKRNFKKIPIINFDIVIHLAAQSSGPKSYKNSVEDFETNCVGTYNLLNFMKENNLKNILFTSSMAVYGDKKIKFVKETSKLKPKSNYGKNKFVAEEYIKFFCKYNIDYTILRLFSVYGPGQDLKNKSQGMLSIYLSYILDNKPIKVAGNLDRIRDFIYIEDVVNVIYKIIINKKSSKFRNQTFNLGAGKKITVLKLINLLKKLFGKDHLKIKKISRTYDDQEGVIANIDKLVLVMNNLQFTPIDKGIRFIKKFYG